MKNIIQKIRKWKKIIVISILLLFAFASGTITNSSQAHVLGMNTHVITTPSPTMTPITPTSAPVTVINTIVVPTQAPIVVFQVATPTPSITSSTPVPTATPTPTPMPTGSLLSPTPTVIPTLSPTISPTPTAQAVEIDIEYQGTHPESVYHASITPNETAWQAIQEAIGIANIHDTDYGGSLGVFITGFNGVDAGTNQYYDFQVNGTSSSVGVSAYTLMNNDVLKFVLTNF